MRIKNKTPVTTIDVLQRSKKAMLALLEKEESKSTLNVPFKLV